jgi:hypothetical protein
MRQVWAHADHTEVRPPQLAASFIFCYPIIDHRHGNALFIRRNLAPFGQLNHVHRRFVSARAARPAFHRRFKFPDRRVAWSANGVKGNLGGPSDSAGRDSELVRNRRLINPCRCRTCTDAPECSQRIVGSCRPPAEPIAAARVRARANLAMTRLRDASPGHSNGIVGQCGGLLIRGYSQPQTRPPARVTSQSLRGPHQVGRTMQVGAGQRAAEVPNARWRGRHWRPKRGKERQL